MQFSALMQVETLALKINYFELMGKVKYAQNIVMKLSNIKNVRKKNN